MIYKSSICHRCGTAPSDWLGPDGKKRESPPFEPVTVACYGCKELEKANAEIPKEKAGYIRASLRKIARRSRAWQMNKFQ